MYHGVDLYIIDTILLWTYQMKLLIWILGVFHLKGIIKGLLNYLLRKKDNVIWRYIIFPAFTLGIPGFIATYYSNTKIASWLATETPNLTIFLNDHPVPLVVISGILVYSHSIFDPVLDYYVRTFQPFKSSPLTILQKTLEILVDAKYQRFKQYLNDLIKRPGRA